MHIAHHPIFVALSIVIACLGSWTALNLFRRVRAHAGRRRAGWLLAAAAAMGLSIWAMHFIAMLGFDPGAEVRYDMQLTLLSLMLAIAATAFAFFFAAERPLYRLFAGGLVMGAGICIMHYVGMAAVITPMRLSNDWVFVALAFLVAITASTGALLVAMHERTFAQRVLAALVLGFAIVGMHYIAMFGVQVSASSGMAPVQSGINSITLAFAVAAGTFFILFLALIAALSDRRIDMLAAIEASRTERQLRDIIEHLPLGVVVAEASTGKIRFANLEAEKLTGHPAEGIWGGDAPYGPVHADGSRLAAEEHAFHQVRRSAGRIGPRLQHYRRSDGEIVRLEVMATLVPDRAEDNPLVVLAFQDVTAKLRAEEEVQQSAALRDSEERFRNIAEQAPVMLWMTDEQGRHVYLNKALRDFWGAPENLSDFDWTTTLMEDRDNFLAMLDSARGENRSFTVEARLRRRDGAVRVVHTFATSRSGNDGKFLGMIGVNVDVTDARRAQTDLQRINELLEERVAAALAEKAQAEAALTRAQRLEAMGRLTGGVAHDFNNLLTVVIGALDMILRHPEDSLRRTRLGEAALAAARRGERLTAQLLAFARRQPLRPEVCDLNHLIREGEPLIRGTVGDALSLDVRLFDGPAIARIDPAQFESALLNLIVNAVDATPTGGRIAVETAVCDVSRNEFPDLEAGPYVRVSVADTGQGMSADVMSRVFEPFFTTKAPGKGTGLGLSQVYGFVKQSGGEVRVESKEGQGTRFSVYLPLFAHGAAEMPSANPVRRHDHRFRVLLVEDDDAVAKITEAMLRDLGHEVLRAGSAEQALQILHSPKPLDLLLSDVVMPGGMNGVELARQAANIRAGLKVLLSSGYAGEAIEQELRKSAWPFLKKPYLEEELAACLQQFLPRPEEATR